VPNSSSTTSLPRLHLQCLCPPAHIGSERASIALADAPESGGQRPGLELATIAMTAESEISPRPVLDRSQPGGLRRVSVHVSNPVA
jgi:hypothetical protein